MAPSIGILIVSVMVFAFAALMFFKARAIANKDKPTEAQKRPDFGDFDDNAVWEVGKLRPIVDIKEDLGARMTKRLFLKRAVMGVAASFAGWLAVRGQSAAWASDQFDLSKTSKPVSGSGITSPVKEQVESHYDVHSDTPARHSDTHTDGPIGDSHFDEHSDSDGYHGDSHTDH